MANVIYSTYRSAALSPGLDLVAGSNLKLALVSTTTGSGGNNYTYSASHQYFSSVPTGAIVAPGVALGSKTVSNGALSAASVVFPNVAQVGSQTGQALILYNDTGNPATSQLIAYMDTNTGLPVTPNGANITVTFSGAVLTLS